MLIIRICGLPPMDNFESLYREILHAASSLVELEDAKPAIYFLNSQLGWHLNKMIHVETIGSQAAFRERSQAESHVHLETGIRQALRQQFGEVGVFFTHSDGRLQVEELG